MTDEETERPTKPARSILSAPIVAFVGVEIFAFVLWLTIGRREWFYHDDWDPLATRKIGDVGDLFRAHNGHWITLPVLMYRLFYWLVGLRAYLPYRIVVLVFYLTASGLLLVVMRRAGVQPWIATAAASLFSLFGTGWANIIRPFQVTFISSLVLGLLYLILVDHDGPFDRRDRVGLLVGLLALMTSGVAVVMVCLVGIAVLLRRGWRLALMHVAPLAVCFAIWLLVIGHEGGVTRRDASPADILSFITEGLREAFGALGPAAWFGALFAVALVVGLVFAAKQRNVSAERAQLAVPLALLAGTLVFLSISAASGVANTGAADARQSRYVSLVAAMMLPALAVAADAFARRWRWFLPIGVALFLVGIPQNIHTARSEQHVLNAIYDRTKRVMLTVAHDPEARHVPRLLRPEPAAAHQVTIGWLLDGVAQHRIPAPDHLTIFDRIWDRFLIAFYQDGSAGPSTNCTTLKRPHALVLKKGDEVGVFGGQLVMTPARTGVVRLNPTLLLDPANGSSISVLRDAGRVRFTAYETGEPPRVCTG